MYQGVKRYHKKVESGVALIFIPGLTFHHRKQNLSKRIYLMNFNAVIVLVKLVLVVVVPSGGFCVDKRVR